MSCCSVVDLNLQHLEERQIEMASFHFNLNGTEYSDDMGKTLSSEDFYKAMIDGADVSTSQVNMDEYTQYFEKFLSAGKDVLHVTLSSGLSGSFNSARIAAEGLREKYPELQYLDREDDMGLPGLRKAKLSYYPHHLVVKFWARLWEDVDED